MKQKGDGQRNINRAVTSLVRTAKTWARNVFFIHARDCESVGSTVFKQEIRTTGKKLVKCIAFVTIDSNKF